MYSAHRSILAVALFFISSFSGTTAFPQAAKSIRNAAEPPPLANASAIRALCIGPSERPPVTPYPAAAASSDADSPCDTPPVIVPSMIAPSVSPCNPSSPAQPGCNPPRDLVQEYLESIGKPGRKILRARERVLEILETENACSAWFRKKDPNPADTFRTLSYVVDRQGEEFILESKAPDNVTIFRNPYVAKVFQGDGRYATITINAKGAFFSPIANVVEVSREGGPVSDRRPRVTDVGPYAGDTMHAQVLVLLHEFGHVLDLLPADENNVDGKSVHNTSEVLRFCRSEVESKGKRATLSVALKETK
jgi:hypothetical protein